MKGYINNEIREVTKEEALITGLGKLDEEQDKELIDIIEKTEGKSLGVFTTLMVKDRVPVFLEEHCRGVLRDAEKAGLEGYDKAELEDTVKKVVRANRKWNYALHIQIREKEGLIIDPFERKYSEEDYKEGIKVISVPWKRHNPEIKEIRPWDIYLMETLLNSLDFSEILYYGKKGNIVLEGGRSNIFVVKDGSLITPEEGIYQGNTRQKIIEIVNDKDIPVKEKYITRYDIENIDKSYMKRIDIETADEVFLTGSVKGVLPVKQVGLTKYKPGKLTEKIGELYNKMVLNYILNYISERNKLDK